MNKIVHYLGLDVHKETIAVAIAPANNTEVRLYGIIGGTFEAESSARNRRRKRSTPFRIRSRSLRLRDSRDLKNKVSVARWWPFTNAPLPSVQDQL